MGASLNISIPNADRSRPYRQNFVLLEAPGDVRGMYCLICCDMYT